MITRLMRPEDRRFIVPTWVRSFAEIAPWGRAATLAGHWAVVDAILDAPETRVMVLASDAAARTLHGWAAGTSTVLHYAFVPPELRGHDLARRCIEAVLGDYPARIETSHPWPEVRGQQHHRFRWNPYALAPAAHAKKAA